MGTGIVPTPDDFGYMGLPPTHPELLDFLAQELIDHNYSLKHIHKLILTSSTYRMKSDIAPQVQEIDPTNMLYHRMNFKRMEGEVIRDSMLQVSHSLKTDLYGASIPTYLTSHMQGRGRPRTSGPLDGAGRRSIYLSVRRNFLSPFFLAFDYPLPMTTTGKRSVSNVPAQSLSLKNNPMVVLLAERLAQDVCKKHDTYEKQTHGNLQKAIFTKTTRMGKRRTKEFPYRQQQYQAMGRSLPCTV